MLRAYAAWAEVAADDSTFFGAPRPRSGVLHAEKILDTLYGADTLTSAFAPVAF